MFTLVDKWPELDSLIAIMLSPAARPNYLLKPSEGFPVHILQETVHFCMGDTQSFQMQCCEFEHAAGASKAEQVQLNVCIPSIF